MRDWQGRSDTLNAPQFFRLAIPDERLNPADLNAYVPDAVVVSLGTNDFNLSLGAFPTQERFRSNLCSISSHADYGLPSDDGVSDRGCDRDR